MHDEHQEQTVVADGEDLRHDVLELLRRQAVVKDDLEVRNATVGIPMIVLITAIALSLVGLSGWVLNIETKKADRVEMTNMKQEIRDDIREVKENLKTVIQKIDLHMERSTR